MKIGLDTAPVTLRGNYFQHLAGVLENYAPEHEYVVDAKRYGHLDLYHGFRSSLPLSVHLGRIPAVMTVPNLDFLRYPHLYTFSERLIALRLYRRALRQARRVITVSTPAREELSRRLRIDPAKIEVMMPLAARVPQEPPLQAELEHTRRKYGLPEMFILMIGTVEPHHNHEAVLDALALLDSRVGVVVCGRRTVYSDFLLSYARERHLATRVDFIYELTPADLPALFRMARVFAYLPRGVDRAGGRGVARRASDGAERHAAQPRGRRPCRRLREPRGPGRGRRGAGEHPLRRVVAADDAPARTPPRGTFLGIRRGGTPYADLYVALTGCGKFDASDAARHQPLQVDLRIADVDAAGQLGGEGRQARQHVVERFAVGKADPPGETPGVEPRCADCEPEAFVVETVVVAAAAVVMLFHGDVDFGDLCAAPVKIRTRTTVCLFHTGFW